MSAATDGNAVEVIVDAKPVSNALPLSGSGWQPVAWRVPVPPGRSRVTLHNRLPGVQPPGDARKLAFQVSDLRWRLEP